MDKAQLKLFNDHLYVVEAIAKMILGRAIYHLDYDDLYQSGCMGLLSAVRKFEPSRGHLFKTYASFRIRGAILDHARDESFMPRSVKEKARAIMDAALALQEVLSREPAAEEIAEYLNLTMDEFYKISAECAPSCIVRLGDFDRIGEEGAGDEHQTPFTQKAIIDLLALQPTEAVIDAMGAKGRSAYVREQIKKLPRKLRMVICLSYYDQMNLKVIGHIMRVTESRVSQMKSEAEGLLREHLAGVEVA